MTDLPTTLIPIPRLLSPAEFEEVCDLDAHGAHAWARRRFFWFYWRQRLLGRLRRPR